MIETGREKQRNYGRMAKRATSGDKGVGTEEQRVYERLAIIATLGDEDVVEVVDWVLRSKLCPSQSWYNLLLYILEREPSSVGRRNIVRIFSNVILAERRCWSRPFTKLVQQGIATISHASDDSGSSEVRVFLHQCIFRWIQAGIVSTQFLKSLEQNEARWSFRGVRPQYSHPASEEAPLTFDLVRLGLQGPGYDRQLDMGKLVKQGMAEGLKEGWLSVDNNGHYAVHVE